MFLLCLFLMAAPAAQARDDGSAVRGILDTGDPALRAERIRDFVGTEPAWKDVYDAIGRGRTYSATPPKGFQNLYQLCSDGKKRPYVLYVPPTYDSARGHRLLVHLHGGVSSPQCPTHERMQGYGKYFWGEAAEEKGFLFIVPTGQKKAEWWTDTGASNILGVIAATKKTYNIDENRVFLTGFSDGASGSFYMALTRPTSFAGFIPLNGHVGVAQAGGLQVHIPNLVNKPLYVVSTGRDSLYPAARIKPYVDLFRKAGADVTYKVYEEVPHRADYLPQERPSILSWMEGHSRNPHPVKVSWETADEKVGRVHWLRMGKIGDTGNNAEFADFNFKIKPSRTLLGINIDPAFEGPGVKVAAVQKGSLAEKSGMKIGDIITGADAKPITTLGDLRGVLGSKRPGDSITVRVKRGEEELTLEGRFPNPEPRPAFARKKPYASATASIDGNTVTMQIRRLATFEILVSPEVFDIDAPLRVMVNGRTLFEGKVRPDVAFMLEQAAVDLDRKMVYAAKLSIVPSDGSEEEDF